MQQLLTRNSHRAVADEIQRQLAFQLAQIQATSLVAQCGVRELDRTHQEASALYEKTMATALQAIQTAAQRGRLTPVQVAALYHFLEAYRYELLSVVEKTGDSLIHELERW